MDPEQEFSRILSVARLGASGETYAFDSTGLMISRSRFDSRLRELGLLGAEPDATAALTLPLLDPGHELTERGSPPSTQSDLSLIQPVAAALAGQNGAEVRPYRDYRGVAVVGAWRWLSQHDFGVVTQMDAREAYQPLRILRMLFLILFLLLVLSANGFFLASYLGAVWHRRLSEAELKARKLGQYQLEEKIGEGGMGVVYRARHALLRRDTAIKLLLPDRADPEAIQRFEREVQLTCQLSHPNTVQIYDYGHTPEGLFYYAMEYLRGLNLKELVLRFGPQPEGRVVHILTQVCDALSEAHHQGLVHRDIKPANVFLTHRGGVPDSVKVLDFGLVRRFRAESETGEMPADERGLVGTPLFMSPESIHSPGRSDPRSDIYSLGALAYFLLTGTYVFDGATLEEVIHKHLHEPPTPPSQRGNVPVSQAFEAVILQCLEKDPARRPASVDELKARLQPTLHAAQWDTEARRAWWSRYEQTVLEPPTPATPAPPEGLGSEVHIDFTTRVG
jgi:serine/threonine protein kinase